MVLKYNSAPHWETNEDHVKSFHSGYFEKLCSECQKPFLVANHIAEEIDLCAKCTIRKRHAKEDNTTTT